MNTKEIALEAQKKGVCAPGLKRIIANSDVDALLDYFVEGLDFCLNENFPSVEYLEKHGKGIMEFRGIHVNEKYNSVNQALNVLLGSCEAIIKADGHAVSEVYVKHSCKAEVIAKDNAVLRVDCFDDSQVSVTASNNAKVTINVYGGARVITSGNVNVVYKNKDRY